jgi:hypothetical protein
MKRASSIPAALAFLLGCVGQIKANTIVNGSFEDGGGSLTGWVVVNQTGGSGSWYVQSGTTSPISSFPVPLPTGGTYAAMTNQADPGSHVLYQDFVVPRGLTSASLSFDRFIGNEIGAFYTRNTLDYSGILPNVQARVDIVTVTADPFSVASSDVLLNIFNTRAGPIPSGYTTQTTDLTSVLTAHQGETLRLRFAEVDNVAHFQFGVDNVHLDVTVVPEPSTLILLCSGIAFLGGNLMRRDVGKSRPVAPPSADVPERDR